MANIIKEQVKEQVKEVVKEVLAEEKDQASGAPKSTPDQQKQQKIVIDCLGAKNAAVQAEQYCLSKGGPLADLTLVNQLHDVMAVCDLMTTALLQQSKLAPDIAKVCGKACQELQKSLTKFKDDAQLQMYGQYIKTCAESCKQVG